MRRLIALFACLVSIASIVAACGGSETGSTTDQMTAGAELLRANTFLYVAVDSDLESDQWQQLDELVRKFPGRERLIAEIKESLAEDEVVYERDIEPAIGPVVYVAVADLPDDEDGDVAFAVLNQPKDDAKFQALLKKGDDPDDIPESRKLDDGWYALSDEQASIDRVLAADGAPTLAENARFQDAMERGDGEALGKLFLNGEPLMRAFETLGKEAGLSAKSLGFERIDWYTVQASAEDDGVRFEGAGKGQATQGALGAYERFTSKLVPQIPDGALAVMSFRGGKAVSDSLDAYRDQPGFEEGLRQFEEMVGVSLDQILPLFENEVAFYVRPGSPIPELTLVLEAPNEERALDIVDKLMGRVVTLGDGERSTSSVDGVSITSMSFGGFAVHYGAFEQRVVITSSRNGIRDFRADGSKLADDQTFGGAVEAAGMPDENSGFVYLNLREGIPLLLDFAAMADGEVPREVTENVRPLTSFLAYGDYEGGEGTFTAFLEID